MKKNSKNGLIIAMSCNKEWYHYLVVDIYSLLECTKNIEKIYLLVETDKVSDIPYLKNIIEKYSISIEIVNLNDYFAEFLSVNSPNRNNIFTDFAFGRLLLPKIVKEDKVIYIDTDAIVRRDISNVWNYDISEYYVAGVKDYGILEENILGRYNITGKYINSGFVVFNLKMIREDDIMNKWFDIVNREVLRFPDQDALNIVCQHKELYLPSMYNSCEYGYFRITMQVINASLIKVFHYAGDKSHWVADRLFAEEWYDAEEKFYNEFVVNEKE